jgi:Ala-tRNA(Pro) deacylase
MDCRERLEGYFNENRVAFEVMTHEETFTMQEVAAALHVPGGQVAKVVMVWADGKIVMLVVSSPDRLDFANAGTLLGAEKVRLAKEEEFGDLFPDCAVGGMPPFGNLYGVPVYINKALTEEEDILFRVGTHTEVMKIAYRDFARLAQPKVGEFVHQT